MSINLTFGLTSGASVTSQPPVSVAPITSTDTSDALNVLSKGLGEATPSREELDKAVASIRSDVQSVHRNLEFSVDEESGIPIVKVIAADSGEVIRQLPSETAVKLAMSLKESSNLLFSEKA
ncbi:flagellar protein FlaG [Pseudomonas oryzihabitans]|uniref:flagellar protein FlaG n=1 Tax=Pseudomonas oryzihabitans TaxID=47885 RepID=UPI0011A474D9|nr:flagellar protein FlaG [Pseudomonas oryzihabitans]